MAQLSIPERRQYEDFFQESEKDSVVKNSERLFSMSMFSSNYVKRASLHTNKFRINNRVINGYTVPKGTHISSQATRGESQRVKLEASAEDDADIEEWLYDKPTRRDDFYEPLTTADIPEELLRATGALERQRPLVPEGWRGGRGGSQSRRLR